MEVFKRIMERTLAHERSKAAHKTRRACDKRIVKLEGMVVVLQDQLNAKDLNHGILEAKVFSLDKEIVCKKGEIMQLEGDVSMIRKVLEEKDKQNSDLLHSLNVLRERHVLQSKTLAAAKKQLALAKGENEDLSQQMWRIIEENGNVNKRILELDMEVQSLEESLTKAKDDLLSAEKKYEVCAQHSEVFRDGYEKKSREIIEITTRERSLQAMVTNLSSELDQWKRNASWIGARSSSSGADGNSEGETLIIRRPSPSFSSASAPSSSSSFSSSPALSLSSAPSLLLSSPLSGTVDNNTRGRMMSMPIFFSAHSGTHPLVYPADPLVNGGPPALAPPLPPPLVSHVAVGGHGGAPAPRVRHSVGPSLYRGLDGKGRKKK